MGTVWRWYNSGVDVVDVVDGLNTEGGGRGTKDGGLGGLVYIHDIARMKLDFHDLDLPSHRLSARCKGTYLPYTCHMPYPALVFFFLSLDH